MHLHIPAVEITINDTHLGQVPEGKLFLLSSSYTLIRLEGESDTDFISRQFRTSRCEGDTLVTFGLHLKSLCGELLGEALKQNVGHFAAETFSQLTIKPQGHNLVTFSMEVEGELRNPQRYVRSVARKVTKALDQVVGWIELDCHVLDS